MIPQEVVDWLGENGYGEVLSSRSVGGGCINNGQTIRSSSGESFFLKTNPSAPIDMFACEASGLAALRIEGGPVIPQPFLVGNNFLLMEDLEPGQRKKNYWEKFGQQLAAVHSVTNQSFGLDQDNYIGSTPQPNPWTEDGYEFFSIHRLMYMAEMAARRGLLSINILKEVEKVTQRLRVLVPAQPASLLHGDLWSGNATTNHDGDPAIIDPAVHYGWAESELAMTTLFGSFSDRFYAAYEEIRPLDQGYRERYPIYNLYHLLNHVNLFGSGYVASVVSSLKRIN